MKKNLIFILILIALAGLISYFLIIPKNGNQPSPLKSITAENSNNSLTPQNPLSQKTTSAFSEPISNALARITKKPFGLKVSPGSSPVSPEKFFGYHTGVDFETAPAEQNLEVAIYAICPGSLVLKKYASGYGGVAVQQCQINGDDVTIIYGHLKLSSINGELNKILKAGQLIGILGQGYSPETGGERKHLHLGIRLGKQINLLGYVQKLADLNQWLDVSNLLKQ